LRDALDVRRIVAVGFAIAGFGLFAVALAAIADVRAGGGSPAGAMGAVTGTAIRGFLDHRHQGPLRALLWAIAYAGGCLGAFVALLVVAIVLRPVVAGQHWPPDVGLRLAAVAFVPLAIGAILWERDPRQRPLVAVAFIALALLFAGLVAWVEDSSVAAILVPAGFGLVVFAAVRSIQLRRVHGLGTPP
jgi:hypothetical protein